MAPRSSSRPRSSNDEPSPSPSSDETTPRPVGALRFASPSDETTDPWTEGPSLPDDASPSPSDEPRDELPDPSDAPPRSSKGSSGNALSKRTLRDAIRQGVLMGGAVAHQLLPRNQAEREVGLYLADEDDAQAIGDPLASIAHRRGGLGEAAANPDVADAIAALIGLALYVAKQIGRYAAARELRQNGPSESTPDGLSDVSEGDRTQAEPIGLQNA